MYQSIKVFYKKASKKYFIYLLPLFIVLLLFFRLYNIDITARFTRDESSDLVKIHQYYQEKKLTLVGPISSGNTKVFGSLTYYMLMPFSVLGNFEPVSPAYGTVFWGILTVLLLVLLTIKINKKLLPYTLVLVLFWYPLLEISRWAWNPHLVPFWIALGILLYLRKTPLSYFLSGLSLSLAFHNHYIALVATVIFILLLSSIFIFKKNLKAVLLLHFGYVVGFIPFIIFDLRHPPGLFFHHYLFQGNASDIQGITLERAITGLFTSTALFLHYMTQNIALSVLLGILCVALVIVDIKKNRQAFLYFLPVICQIVAGVFLGSPQTRYLLPGLVFFFVWLLFPRKALGGFFAKGAFIVMIFGAIFSVYSQLHFTEFQPDTRTISKANKVIEQVINQNKLQKVNIALLASPAKDTTALTFRDTLLIRDIHFMADSEYNVSQHLFVLSTSDELVLRNDKAYQMELFKDAKLGGIYHIDNGEWKLYWFKKI